MSPGRSSKFSLKALSAFIVASRTCEIFGPFRVRTCVRASLRDSRPFGVVRTKNASRDKRKKCWRKKKFFLARPPLTCHGTFQERSWQHADKLQVCTRTFFSCPIFGFSVCRDFPAHFSVCRKRWDSLPVSERNHVISSQFTDAGRQARTDSSEPKMLPVTKEKNVGENFFFCWRGPP